MRGKILRESSRKSQAGQATVAGRVAVTVQMGTPTRRERLVIEEKDLGANQRCIPTLTLPPSPALPHL